MTEKQGLIRGVSALALHMGVHKTTIIKYNAAGKLKYQQIGKTKFYDPNDLFVDQAVNAKKK